MKKTILTFIILILIVHIFANLPDFKRIVEKIKQTAEQKAQLYSKWMGNMREDTCEMDNYDVRYYFIDISIDFDIEYVEAIIESFLEIVENNVSEISYNFTNDLTYALYNYPNPFNPSGAGRSPSTTISFNITAKDAEQSPAFDGNAETCPSRRIEIYNIKGQKVRTLRISNTEHRITNQSPGMVLMKTTSPFHLKYISIN